MLRFRKDNGCSIANALVLFVYRLESKLRKHPDSLMFELSPTNILIGSMPESTRLGNPSEIDVTNQLQGLKPEYFERKIWILFVTSVGKTFFGTHIFYN